MATSLVAEKAAESHDVLDIDELRALGLSSSAVQKRVQAGDLFPMYPGVYAWGRPDLRPSGHRMAAVKACGRGAALSFAAAAAHRKMRWSSATVIDVTIPAGRPLLRLQGIRCHRARLAPQDVGLVDGIPTTSVARTLLDLSSRFRDDTVIAAANESVIEGIFDRREIENLLRRSKGRRGVRRFRRVLESGDLKGEDVLKSGLERHYADLLTRAGLPTPLINRWILLGDEYHQVDFLWRREHVVIEVDSNRYHQTGWKLARDERRSALLLERGWRHDRIPEDEMTQDPSAAVERAARLLGRR